MLPSTTEGNNVFGWVVCEWVGDCVSTLLPSVYLTSDNYVFQTWSLQKLHDS